MIDRLIADMTISLHDVLGILGSTVIVLTYSLLQLQKLQSIDPSYSILNALGAGLILFSLTVEFNLSAFLVESFWLLISLIGIFRTLRNPKWSGSGN